MTDIIVIRNADWVVGWDEARAQHCFRRDGDVAFSAAGIVQAGGRYDGPFAEERSGRGLMIMPGLIDIHCHSGDEPMAKGVFDDMGTPALYGNALYEYSTLLDFDDDPDALAAGLTVMLCELMQSGVTTVLDLTRAHGRWIDIMAESGVRGYVGPGFRQAAWRVVDSHRLDYEWNETRGRERFAEALEFADKALSHKSGRISAILAPSQIETCREDLLVDAQSEARKRGISISIHAAQTMAEHEELLRRTGLTAPQFMDRLGLLGPDLIIGHGIFLDHHSWTRQRTANDLTLLAERGAAVAHCPVAFARSGMTLDTVGRYQRAGVTLGLGTDTYPFNLLEEMRQALLCARITGRNFSEVSTGDIFHAATVGGAKALRRSDIGKLAPGAKADLVLVDLSHPTMQPVYDPLRSLLHCAAERAVRDVFVDGRQVVRDGKHMHLDYAAAAEALQGAQERALAKAPNVDLQHRPLAKLAPLSLPQD